MDSNKLPDFLNQELRIAIRTTNNVAQYLKLIHFSLKLCKFFVSILYGYNKQSAYSNNSLDRIIINSFYKPSEGTWLNLLRAIVRGMKPRESGADIIKLFSRIESKSIRQFMSLASNILNQNFAGQVTYLDVFEKIINLKNRKLSHNFSSESQYSELSVVLVPLLKDMVHHFEPILNLPIYLLEENQETETIEYMAIHNEISNEIINAKIIDGFTQNGLYTFINKSFVELKPFLVCRDGNIYLYDSFSPDKQKVNYLGFNGTETYLRTALKRVGDLFNIDSDSLKLSPLYNSIKISHNGIVHNLPDKNFTDFIGRKQELNDLRSMILHPRHYITALDGIGGVGKTALSLKFCHDVVSNCSKSELYFDYIVWVSAKTTMLKNGKIISLTQSFEHLNQLVDTILDVLDFAEYNEYDLEKKVDIVIDLLEGTKALIVIDNLETIKRDNLLIIWDFINKLPLPCKVLLTSREYHYDISQHLSISNFNNHETSEFVYAYCKKIGLESGKIESYLKQIVHISSGLPIAIISILGQLYIGKSFKSIHKSILSNKDNLSKFCFEDQISFLEEDHKKVLLSICLSTESLNFEAITYMLENDLLKPITDVINVLKSLSLILISVVEENELFSVLPLVKNHIRHSVSQEMINFVEAKLADYYQLKEIDSYSLFPVEDRVINRGSLIPRKLVDKAMRHAEAGEYEESQRLFDRATQDYPDESYVWYIYSEYCSRFKQDLSQAISFLKKAKEHDDNYIYYKKIGDYHLKLKNYDSSVSNYNIAISRAQLNRNKSEMVFCLGNAEFERAKFIRREIRNGRTSLRVHDRNKAYGEVIKHFERYLSLQEEIYDAKKIKIYRCLAEAYFGNGNRDKAIMYIDHAISLSSNDEHHVNYKKFIISR